ncbi:MAG: VCBS repeat-containing protein [Planctomycetales bacterium]|nr:VCBS repeat-containing protein [Planctomycetales bacterium]
MRPLESTGDDSDDSAFVHVARDRHGIDFRHTWTPGDQYARLIDGPFPGGGVCIGDYDGDARPDVFVTRPFGGARLFRNLGQWRFEDVTPDAGLSGEAAFWSTGATWADVDNDGDLDLYVCGYDCPNRLYINNGRGSFDEQGATWGVDFHGASIMAAFADYDRDGDLDAFLVTNRYAPPQPDGSIDHIPTQDQARALITPTPFGPQLPDSLKELYAVVHLPDQQQIHIVTAGQRATLWRNDGGHFTDVTSVAGMEDYGLSLSATWWDYDQDGWPDLYLANDFFSADRLYHNKGDGTFADVIGEALPHTPWFSMGCNVADLNNDGWLDLMATDMSGTTHYKQKVSMGDMDRSLWFLDSAEPRQYMRNAVYINTQTNRFFEVAQMAGLANSDWTWAVKFGDLDCDGREDLFITNGMTADWVNSDLQIQYGQGWEGMQGHIEPKKDLNIVMRNDGNLHFTDVSAAWQMNDEAVSFGAAYGDLDGDGDLDAVVSNLNDEIALLENRLPPANRMVLHLRGTKSNHWGIGSLVRVETAEGVQARYLTLAHSFMSADEPVVHFGLGNTEKIAKLSIHWPSGVVQELNDLPANSTITVREPDQAADLTNIALPERVVPLFAPASQSRVAVHTENVYDDFAAQPLLPNRQTQYGPGLAVGDVDGDGDDDLYVSGAAGSPGLLRRNDQGRFVSARVDAFTLDQDSEDLGALFFDADGDGDLDLYVVSGGGEINSNKGTLRDRLYLNDSRGDFRKADDSELPPVTRNGSCVVAADYDRDGDLDLFVGTRSVPGKYPASEPSQLLRNDSTGDRVAFTDVLADHPDLNAPNLVTAALWSDADGDGWIDLLVATEWGPIQCYRNVEGRLQAQSSEGQLSQHLGWWNGIAAGDVDEDGDMDYVVTNFGLNTKYHPSPSDPVAIYFGVFGDHEEPRIVEAKMSHGELLPVRGKSCSQNAMPFLQQKFPTYHEFAIAGLTDIYTQTCLDQALKRTANDLQSSLLINDGQGNFEVRPLPRLAQTSPAFGVVVLDVDLDSHLDIVLAQNFFGPQLETGRMDGGLGVVLLGDGQGGFAALSPAESGIVVPEDAKSLVATDVDGDQFPELLVGLNDDVVKQFAIQRRPANSPVVVRLKGRPPNTQAVGARLHIHQTSGRQTLREIHAGDGYLSQSSCQLVLPAFEAGTIEVVTVIWPDGSSTEHSADELLSGVLHQQK